MTRPHPLPLLLPLALLLAGACTVRVPDHGTFVGNPGTARIRAAPPKGLSITSVQLSDGSLLPTDCDGQDGEIIPLQGVDLQAEIALPEGEWCGLAFSLAGDTFVFADGEQGGTLEAPLDVARISLASPTPVDLGAQAWVVELGSPLWLSAEDVGLEPDQDLVLDPHSPPAEQAAARVGTESSLFADTDRDGQVGESERDAGPAMFVDGR